MASVSPFPLPKRPVEEPADSDSPDPASLTQAQPRPGSKIQGPASSGNSWPTLRGHSGTGGMSVRTAPASRPGNSSVRSDTPLPAHRSAAPQPAEGGERPFDGHRDARLHPGRRGARVGGPHGEFGVGEIRQQVHRQARERHRPEQHHGGVEHGCRHGAADGKANQARVWVIP